jgi:hypothetical protein
MSISIVRVPYKDGTISINEAASIAGVSRSAIESRIERYGLVEKVVSMKKGGNKKNHPWYVSPSCQGRPLNT